MKCIGIGTGLCLYIDYIVFCETFGIRVGYGYFSFYCSMLDTGCNGTFDIVSGLFECVLSLVS